jgi:hypothetical protein
MVQCKAIATSSAGGIASPLETSGEKRADYARDDRFVEEMGQEVETQKGKEWQALQNSL